MLRDADPGQFAGIYIVCGYTDLRFGIDTLAALVERKYQLPILVPNTLFLFCGRKSDRIKGLVWEGDGFLLLTKRVANGHYCWPRNAEEARQLSPQQLRLLMQGFSVEPAIKEISPQRTA